MGATEEEEALSEGVLVGEDYGEQEQEEEEKGSQHQDDKSLTGVHEGAVKTFKMPDDLTSNSTNDHQEEEATTREASGPAMRLGSTTPKPIDLALAKEEDGEGKEKNRRLDRNNLSSERQVREYEELTDFYNEYIDR